MTPVSNIIKYATLAATTTRDIASSGQVPFLASAASLSLSIVRSVELLKSNKTEFLRLVEQIHEILCAIVDLYSRSHMNGILPPTLLYNIAQFARTLQKIYTFLDAQQGMGKLKRIIKQADTNSQLNSCKSELETVQERFTASTGVAEPEISVNSTAGTVSNLHALEAFRNSPGQRKKTP
ncbi:hypothetical protein C8R43DRAFT_944763 [Mycena crocata]|nr:hypothetical protein C8R43DRAFT_944763 [Mycena crocata]